MAGTRVYEWHPYTMVAGIGDRFAYVHPRDDGVGVPFINPRATDVNAPGSNDLQYSYVDAVGSNEDQ
jgi:hypothetical protein